MMEILVHTSLGLSCGVLSSGYIEAVHQLQRRIGDSSLLPRRRHWRTCYFSTRMTGRLWWPFFDSCSQIRGLHMVSQRLELISVWVRPGLWAPLTTLRVHSTLLTVHSLGQEEIPGLWFLRWTERLPLCLPLRRGDLWPPPAMDWEKERIVLLLSELSELGGLFCQVSPLTLGMLFFFFSFLCTWVNWSFVLDLGGVDVPDTGGPCRPRPCDEPAKDGGTEDLS